jgi:glycosyltransferase involved in cell wall biosynthesis
MTYPLISVIVPAYNSEQYLKAALDSILDQKYPNLEILLVDDGSTDQTRWMVETHPADCIYIYQQNQGPAGARNGGISRATGSYITFLDSDDVYLPGKLLSQFHYLEQNPEIDMVLCAVQRTDENLTPFAAPMTCFLFGAALIRREVFDRVGFCNLNFIRGDDLDWYLRAKDLGISIAQQTEIGLLYRQHTGSMMSNVLLNREYFYRALRESSRRQKNATVD